MISCWGGIYLFKWFKQGILVFFVLSIGTILMHFYVFESGSQLSTRGTDTTKQLLFFKYFLHELFREGNFYWSWSYGLGGDIFGQFNYYYSFSPFFLFTLLFDISTLTDVAGWTYRLSMIKHFVAMLSLFALLSYHRCSFTGSLTSALMYGGTILFAYNSLQFEFMLDPFIWLPLLVLSFELYTDNGKKWPFIIMVAIMVANNFYFGFISTIYIIIFSVYKYFDSNEIKCVKGFMQYVFRASLLYLIGLGIASFAFLPSVYQFLHTDRLTREYTIPLLFDWNHYKNVVLLIFFPYKSAPQISYSIGLSLLAFIVIVLGIVIKSKQLMPKKILLGTFFILFLFPFSYSFFNGMSSMQSRWLYLFSFTICFVFPFFLDEIDRRKSKRTSLMIVTCLCLLLYTAWLGQGKDQEVLVNNYINLGIGILSSIFFMNYISNKRWIWSWLLILTVIVNGAIQHYIYYDSALGDASLQKEANRTYLSSISFDNEEAKQIIEKINQEDLGFYRIIWDHPNVEFNAPMYYGYKGNSAYQSLISSNVHQFFKEDYNILQFDSMSLFRNYDNRLFLETATSNKYYITLRNSPRIPYGYEKLWETKNWAVYENTYFLPVGFLYEKWVSKLDFEHLNPAERDQLMLEAAVISNEEFKVGRSIDNESLSTSILHSGFDGVQFHNIADKGSNRFQAVSEESSEIVIPIQKPDEAGEIFVEIDIENTEGLSFVLSVNGKSLEKRPNSLPWSYPKTNFVINTGWDNNVEEINLNISEGEYIIRDIKVYFNSYQNYEDKVTSLQESGLTNIRYTEQSLSGKFNVDKEGVFFLSVPFSKGWNIQLNGQEVDFYEVNHTFIGIPVKEGDYTLEMEYVTPLVREGIFVSIISVVIALVYHFVPKRKKQV